jgi:hypothetical protein
MTPAIGKFAGLLEVNAEQVARWTFVRVAVSSASVDRTRSGSVDAMGPQVEGNHIAVVR